LMRGAPEGDGSSGVAGTILAQPCQPESASGVDSTDIGSPLASGTFSPQ
jgi:hypothetical protein